MSSNIMPITHVKTKHKKEEMKYANKYSSCKIEKT